MDVELRSISRADLKYFLTTCEAAFGWDVKDEEVERVGKILKPERTIAAYDGETMVGTAADYEFTLTVPGAKLIRRLISTATALSFVCPLGQRGG
jgi:hypothetical protein